jgi:hypothetical protein
VDVDRHEVSGSAVMLMMAYTSLFPLARRFGAGTMRKPRGTYAADEKEPYKFWDDDLKKTL